MATQTKPRTDQPAPATPLPTLESGDHLTAAEFHARYEQRPDL
ncbi:MAG: Uma2 family endonuclease, partial [Dehalococcoidia bacterium]|nr:Uma2 family endonuclease [Dehalococcoidia bacterium]